MNAGLEADRGRLRSLLQRGLFAAGVAALALSFAAGLVRGYEMSRGVPFGALAYQRITRQYLQSGDYEAAVLELRGEQRINEAPSAPTLNLAAALRALGDEDAALEALRIGARQSLDPLLHVRYAQALAAIGRDAEAEESMRRALAIEPTNARTYVDVGNFLARHGRFEEAAQSYERALAIDASLGEARFMLTNLQDRVEGAPGAAPAGADGAR